MSLIDGLNHDIMYNGLCWITAVLQRRRIEESPNIRPALAGNGSG
jgi:hypothetical protein